MRESISYAFILNIMITFIFICFSVVMGIFSYYRAFRANTAILNSLEKYEGYNCLSIAEIDKQLKNIGYNPSFKINNKGDNKGEVVTVDNDYLAAKGYKIENGEMTAKTPMTEVEKYYGPLGYSIIYYNHANDDLKNKYVDEINSYSDKEYQFGTFTYMYMDLPIINSIFKVPIYGKTDIIYDFREIITYESKMSSEQAIFSAETWNKIKESGKDYASIEYDKRMLLKSGNIRLIDLGVSIDKSNKYKMCTASQYYTYIYWAKPRGKMMSYTYEEEDENGEIVRKTGYYRCSEINEGENPEESSYWIGEDGTKVLNFERDISLHSLSSDILQLAASVGTASYELEPRAIYKADADGDGVVNSVDASAQLRGEGRIMTANKCGTYVDFSKYYSAYDFYKLKEE